MLKINKKDLAQVLLYILGLCYIIWAYNQPHDSFFYKKFDKANATMFFIMSSLIFIEWFKKPIKCITALCICATTIWNLKDYLRHTETHKTTDELFFGIIVCLIFFTDIFYIIWYYYRKT